MSKRHAASTRILRNPPYPSPRRSDDDNSAEGFSYRTVALAKLIREAPKLWARYGNGNTEKLCRLNREVESDPEGPAILGIYNARIDAILEEFVGETFELLQAMPDELPPPQRKTLGDCWRSLTHSKDPDFIERDLARKKEKYPELYALAERVVRSPDYKKKTKANLKAQAYQHLDAYMYDIAMQRDATLREVCKRKKVEPERPGEPLLDRMHRAYMSLEKE